MYFTEKQTKVLREPFKRWNILYGATRAGKTVVSYYKFIEALQMHKNDNILMCGKTLNTLERNVLGEMRKLFGEKYISRIQDKREVCIFGKKCFVCGANDERAITKIQGSGLGLAYLDELTTYPQNFFEMLKSRLDKADSYCIATCNPESPSHFVKQFIDNPNTAAQVYAEQFTIYDNTFLAKEFVTALENEYRGTIYFDKWILGKWVKSEGLVFPLFKRDRHYLTEKQYADKYDPQGILYPVYCIFGVDGANTNDSTSIQPVVILSNGQAVRVEPFYHNPKVNGQLSNEQLVPYIAKYFQDLEEKHQWYRYGTQFITVVDCAAADLVLTLAYHFPRYNVQKYTAKNILQTTDTVNNALSRDAVHLINYGGYYNYIRGEFIASECDQLVTDLELMVWDDRQPDKYDSSVPNDCCDAFRYALCTYYNNIDNLYQLAGERGAYR